VEAEIANGKLKNENCKLPRELNFHFSFFNSPFAILAQKRTKGPPPAPESSSALRFGDRRLALLCDPNRTA
jgi:hypothetical protein